MSEQLTADQVWVVYSHVNHNNDSNQVTVERMDQFTSYLFDLHLVRGHVVATAKGLTLAEAQCKQNICERIGCSDFTRPDPSDLLNIEQRLQVVRIQYFESVDTFDHSTPIDVLMRARGLEVSKLTEIVDDLSEWANNLQAACAYEKKAMPTEFDLKDPDPNHGFILAIVDIDAPDPYSAEVEMHNDRNQLGEGEHYIAAFSSQEDAEVLKEYVSSG